MITDVIEGAVFIPAASTVEGVRPLLAVHPEFWRLFKESAPQLDDRSLVDLLVQAIENKKGA